MPRFLGYSFNPLTIYYVYDSALVALILEVHNTFAEKHIYVIPYSTTSQSIARRFHVSPFNDRLGSYRFKASPPNRGISIEITLVSPDSKAKFIASLKRQSEASFGSIVEVLRLCIEYGWWIFLTYPRILVQAWKLHYLKQLPIYSRPEPFDEKGTIERQYSSSKDLYSSSRSLLTTDTLRN